MKKLSSFACAVLLSTAALPQAPALISMQGRLLSGGNPVNGPQNLTFRVYTTVAGGSPVWTETHSSVPVTDGIYNVQLGAYTSLAGFDFSRLLFLGVQVGSASELSPRTVLTSVPAAMTLSPPALIKGPVAGPVLRVENLDGRPGNQAIYGRAVGFDNIAIHGEAVDITQSEGVGVQGTTQSDNGVGVMGRAPRVGVVGTGVFGETASTTGYGVAGVGPNTGVHGLATSSGPSASVGVRGHGGHYGVWGSVFPGSVGGFGVFGGNPAAGGIAVGGFAEATSGPGIGVEGKTASLDGVGVHGLNTTTGIEGGSTELFGVLKAWGVLGESLSPIGMGVEGVTHAVSGGTVGVRGVTYSTIGTGVKGVSLATSGVTYGVVGSVESPEGYAGLFMSGKGVRVNRLQAVANSDGFSPQIDLEEQDAADYARLRLRNTSNVHYWDVAGGFTNNTTLNFFSSQRGNVLSVRAAGSPLIAINGAYLSEGGVWTDNSSVNAKTAFSPIDAASVLDRLSGLTVREWSYRTEDGVRHMGPMAEDFFEAFGLGNDNRSLAALDVNGVALVAIQALLERVEALEEEVRVLKGKR